jgi:hypothetical protein
MTTRAHAGSRMWHSSHAWKEKSERASEAVRSPRQVVVLVACNAATCWVSVVESARESCPPGGACARVGTPDHGSTDHGSTHVPDFHKLGKDPLVSDYSRVQPQASPPHLHHSSSTARSSRIPRPHASTCTLPFSVSGRGCKRDISHPPRVLTAQPCHDPMRGRPRSEACYSATSTWAPGCFSPIPILPAPGQEILMDFGPQSGVFADETCSSRSKQPLNTTG